ncbi:DUF2489 domain-containing protein [Oceanimonas baumannii]|uniref:Uncharacterized protein DUF2489 n=1 Tax=Oceanimonas baumannii TaxID=129578 RepID=A0A235CIH8_9GAMM|nr:DUF2489 domain-containing protein [Oceanimonas baumannii]MCC4263396.1 DUF2489 domain-containing protein [Oceanimonas baumannii]OYD24266.1 hypothetical protein B6S09_09340 [Oceanimonas baumannii]TDW58996.1 uncharacterized protein DUF2489 [Oceanimonas baumannii]
MISPWLIAALAGGVIIVVLAVYAGILLARLRQQTQFRQQAITRRNERILESVRVIALAVKEDQCNLSEGAIRLTNLLNALQFDQPRNFAEDYPGLYDLYDRVKELPTHEARKQLKRNERMKQDLQRAGHEGELEATIKTEVERLVSLELPGL